MTTKSLERIEPISPASRPDFRKLVAPLADACWPEFMLHDAIADEHWGALFERFPAFQFGLLDTQTGQAIAMGNSVALQWNESLERLSERGWDWALEQAVLDQREGRQPNIQCAIQIAILPEFQGQGLSSRLVETMRGIGRSMGFRQLIAPVRPSQKALYPLADIDHYISWKTADGLPFDAWLRVHAHLGARTVKVCHESMKITGSLEDWENWTNLKFPESGQYYIPGALNPVEADLTNGQAVYFEPNVWIVHDLA